MWRTIATIDPSLSQPYPALAFSPNPQVAYHSRLSPASFNALIDPVYKWVNETTSRVPMTDWYDTVTGKQVGFQARSVVGGLFIKALDDRTLAQRWRDQSKAPGRPAN